MGPIAALDHLANPLVTSEQLWRAQNDTVEDVASQRFAQAKLTQAAGILLRLPQEIIASAIVILQRYSIHQSSHTGEIASPTISAAAVYLTAKSSFKPLSPRSVINVYAYLNSHASILNSPRSEDPGKEPDSSTYFVSEGTYEREKQKLFVGENLILATIGFNTHVALPHALALTYLQALGASRSRLACRVLEHLNGGLMSPQLLYLTHQPNALAVAAIYLAARETEVKLVDGNWWEVFDVDREDLGFLVLAFGSLENVAQVEHGRGADDVSPNG